MSWTLQQVAQHSTASSCWVIIHNKVYDVTEFLPLHPGGAQIILKYAGRDATAAYDPIHPPDALKKNLPSDKHLGAVSPDAANTLSQEQQSRRKTRDELRVEKAFKERPLLSRVLSLSDMEDIARRTLSYKALAYYASAADDEISATDLSSPITRLISARVMRAVGRWDPSTTILGYQTSIPVFVSGAALAKLGHPLGEENITRGIAPANLIQMVSSNASLSYADIIASAAPSQTLFFQLYKHADDKVAAERVREVERLGYKAIWLTVDAIVPGNRERDIRSPWVLEEMERSNVSGESGDDVPRSVDDMEVLEEGDLFGTAGALIKYDDQNMTWEKTIPWLRSVTKLPIVIKGIQCVPDAVLAMEAGVDGILLSNHGGRQLEYSLPPMEVLYQLRRERPDVFDKMEGGIRRGTDVLKALCLGARAVGLGRPFLYAQSAYGTAGVTKIVQILEREIHTGMRLLGASTIADLKPDLVQRVDWQPLLRSKL